MISRKTAVTISLGLIVFAFFFEIFKKEPEIPQHELIKIQVTFPYTLNPVTASGTASTVSGPVTFTKV